MAVQAGGCAPSDVSRRRGWTGRKHEGNLVLRWTVEAEGHARACTKIADSDRVAKAAGPCALRPLSSTPFVVYRDRRVSLGLAPPTRRTITLRPAPAPGPRCSVTATPVPAVLLSPRRIRRLSAGPHVATRRLLPPNPSTTPAPPCRACCTRAISGTSTAGARLCAE